MYNILMYVGMSLQSEVCMWTLLGLLRTIFDATLFKVNANLKQVWQMKMPSDLSMPVQRVLRTMISGVMLVKCFTLYVYLASYIVMLYPVFLEERPILLLPWLLLAAIRKLLCELTSLALGLGTCVLLGPARPPCIKFLIFKLADITPAFYMWMLVLSYYNSLKLAAAFKTFPAVLPSSDHDYGLELAIRRRRTKSLLKEDQLRNTLIANFYNDTRPIIKNATEPPTIYNAEVVEEANNSLEDFKIGLDALQPISASSNKERAGSETTLFDDFYGGTDIAMPRDGDRVMEQFVMMLLRIGMYLRHEGIDPVKLFNTQSPMNVNKNVTKNVIGVPAIHNEDHDPPPQVGNTKGKTASYLREYPQIFMKKSCDKTLQLQCEQTLAQSLVQSESMIKDDCSNVTKSSKRTTSILYNDPETEAEKIISRKISPTKVNEGNIIPNVPNKTNIPEGNKVGTNLNDKKNKTYLKHAARLDKPKNTPEVEKTSSLDSVETIVNRMKSRLAASEIREKHENAGTSKNKIKGPDKKTNHKN